jgi:hypothetical protein
LNLDYEYDCDYDYEGKIFTPLRREPIRFRSPPTTAPIDIALCSTESPVMRPIRTLPSLALSTALLLAPVLTTAQPTTPPDSTSTSERCAEFCRRLYTEDEAKGSECVAGCATAEACANDCAARFAEDQKKLDNCKQRCARAR